jgi:hypothetical protein
MRASSQSGGSGMTGEACILANRHNAEESPGRGSPGANDLIVQNKANSQIPCCAKQSQFRGPVGRELRACRAKQSQFAGRQMDANCCAERWLREKARIMRLRKQSQFILASSLVVCPQGHQRQRLTASLQARAARRKWRAHCVKQSQFVLPGGWRARPTWQSG